VLIDTLDRLAVNGIEEQKRHQSQGEVLRQHHDLAEQREADFQLSGCGPRYSGQVGEIVQAPAVATTRARSSQCGHERTVGISGRAVTSAGRGSTAT
jgi:hypothetical protein